MLVLTRRPGESVILEVNCGNGNLTKIEVVAFGIDQGQMKLGFKAPKTVSVTRSEIHPNP